MPQRDTPDPTSAPIRKVLNAFQGNTNSSGTSTKAALDALKDESGAVPAPSAFPSPGQVAVEAFKEESGAFAVPRRELSESKSAPIESVLHAFQGVADTPGTSATQDALDFIKEPSSAAIVVAPAAADHSTPTPSHSRAPSDPPALPEPPQPGRADATPSPVATEPSNSTSPGANSFAEAPSSRGRTGDLDDDDRAAIAPTRAFDVAAFLRTTRGRAIAGGSALLFLVVLVLVLKGGTPDKKTPVAAPTPDEVAVAPPEKPVTDVAPAAETDNANDGDNAGATAATGTDDLAAHAGDSSETEQPSTETPATDPTGTTDTANPPATTSETAPVHKKLSDGGPKRTTGRTIGGKQVVLEYDNQARTAKAVPNNAAQADQSAIARARQSYAAGNQRLFAGDADGAIRNYKQALAYYPAYVAGYRGLGLAYAQQGNKPAALKALRTYLSSVPTAKDAGLIRKRVAALHGK